MRLRGIGGLRGKSSVNSGGHPWARGTGGERGGSCDFAGAAGKRSRAPRRSSRERLQGRGLGEGFQAMSTWQRCEERLQLRVLSQPGARHSAMAVSHGSPDVPPRAGRAGLRVGTAGLCSSPNLLSLIPVVSGAQELVFSVFPKLWVLQVSPMFLETWFCLLDHEQCARSMWRHTILVPSSLVKQVKIG